MTGLVISLTTAANAQDSGVAQTLKLHELRTDACSAADSRYGVLLAGGSGANGPLASVERYRPELGFQAMPALHDARTDHACAITGRGWFAVLGGITHGELSADVEILAPNATSFKTSLQLAQPRAGHTAISLRDDTILVVGGRSAAGADPTIEVVNLASGTVQRLPATLARPRSGLRAVLLSDGRVLLAGGIEDGSPSARLDIYNPDLKSITPAGTLLTARHDFALTLLRDGKVLIAGGIGRQGELDSTEIYDPETQKSTAGPAMLHTRSGLAALQVDGNGSVLIGSGSSGGQLTSDVEVLTPWDRRVSRLGSFSSARRNATFQVASPGVAIAAGGNDGTGPLDSTDRFKLGTLRTDKLAYHSGDTPVIRGEGWTPGDVLLLSMKDQGTLWSPQQFRVQADEKGQFSFQGFVVPAHTGQSAMSFIVGSTSGEGAAQHRVRTIGANSVSKRLPERDASFLPGSTVCTQAAALGQPTNLTGTAASTTSINLAWTFGNGDGTLLELASIASTTYTAAATVSSSATSLSVTSSAGIAVNNYLYVNGELLKVSAINGNTLTVVRAQDDSSAVTIPNGEVIYLLSSFFVELDYPSSRQVKGGQTTGAYTATGLTVGGAYVFRAHSYNDAGGTKCGVYGYSPAVVTTTTTPSITVVTTPSSVATGSPLTVSAQITAYCSGTLNVDFGDSTSSGPITIASGRISIGKTYSSPGGYTITATYDGAGSCTANSGTTLISVSAGCIPTTFTVTDPMATYTGLPQSASISASPGGASYSVTYTGTGSTTYGPSTTPPTNAGTYSVTVSANGSYLGSESGTLTITPAEAFITLGNLTTTYDGSPKAVTASTTPGGLAVNVTYNGSSTAPTNAGFYSVTATISDPNYQGSLLGTLSISPALAAVTMSNLSVTYDGAPKTPTATTVPAGLSVFFLYLPIPVTPINVGSYAVTASISDPNYYGSTTGTLVINKATALPGQITLSGLSAVYNGLPQGATASTSLSGGSTFTYTYTGTGGTNYPTSSNPPINAGTYTVVATLSNSNYQGTASDTLVILPGTAQVTMANLGATYDGSPKAVTAITSPSGLTVTFTYNGSLTPPTNAGSYTVVGTVADANYQGSLSGTLVIAKATATISLSDLTAVYDGTPKGATAVSNPPGLTVQLAYNVPVGLPINAGPYAILAVIDNPNYQGLAGGTFTITKAPATVTLGNLSAVFDGSAKSATATTTPAGLPVTFTYDGNPTAPTNVGNYAVVGTVSDPNYQGSANGTLAISFGTATSGQLTLSGLAVTYDGSPKSATASTSLSGVSSFTYTYTGTNGTTYATTPNPPVDAGAYTVVATLINPNYQGTVTGTLVISKAPAAVTLSNLTPVYDGALKTVSVSTLPGALPYTVTYNGNASPPYAPGSYIVVATINSPNYQGGTSGTLVISKSAQSITFSPNFHDQVFGAGPFTLSAIGSSGQAITFTASGSCAVNGSVLTLTSTGICTVVASQAGTNGYEPTSLTQSFQVTKAPVSVTLTSSATSLASGQPLTLTATVAPASAAGTITFKSSSTTLGTANLVGGTASLTLPNLNAGTYTMVAEFGGSQVYLNASSAAKTISVVGQIVVNIATTAGPAPIPPAGLQLSTVVGSSTGPSLSLQASGASATTLSVACNVPWLTCTPASVTLPGNIQITAVPTGLAAGTYTTTITLQPASAPAAPITIPFTLIVQSQTQPPPPPPPGTPSGLTVTPTRLSFQRTSTAQPTAAALLSVASNGSAVNYSTTVQLTNGSGWLQIPTTTGATPSSLGVVVDFSNLSPGTYVGKLIVTPSNGGTPVEVPVEVNVPQIWLAPESPAASAIDHSSLATGQLLFVDAPVQAPASRNVEEAVIVRGETPRRFTVSVQNAPWLTVTPMSGFTPARLSFHANRANLTPGTYTGKVIVTEEPLVNAPVSNDVLAKATGAKEAVATSSVELNVQFLVDQPVPLSVTPGQLTFTYTRGSGGAPQSNRLQTVTTSTAPLYVAKTPAAWLSVPASTTASAGLDVTLNPASLATGEYRATITVGNPGAGVPSVAVPVILNVVDPPSHWASVAPQLLQFNVESGVAVSPQTASITVDDNRQSDAVIIGSAPWIVVPSRVRTPGPLSVSVNPAGLASGTYQGYIDVYESVASIPVRIQVQMTVRNRAALVPAVSVVTLRATGGATSPATTTVALTAANRNLSYSVRTTIVTPAGGNWLSVSPISGTTPTDLKLQANPAGLSAGTYRATVTLTPSETGLSPVVIEVQFTVDAPQVTLSGLVNAASFRQAGGVPLELVTLFGSNLTCQTPKVSINGVAGEVQYAGANQINFLVPEGVGTGNRSLQFECGTATPVRMTLQGSAVSPGIFTSTLNGLGQAAALNQDFSFNGAGPGVSSGAPGSIVMLYGTGFGALGQPGSDGLRRVLADVKVRIGGKPAEVIYAGNSPGSSLGLTQINVRIPEDTPRGVPATVEVLVDGISSQANVTIAIR